MAQAAHPHAGRDVVVRDGLLAFQQAGGSDTADVAVGGVGEAALPPGWHISPAPLHWWNAMLGQVLAEVFRLECLEECLWGDR